MNDFKLEYAEPGPADSDRADFLRRLKAASGLLDLSEWDRDFLDDTVGRSHFTPAQRREIDRMNAKYAIHL